MIKYASNGFLATKISFMNELARLCDRLSVDVKEVATGMGLDRRIGPISYKQVLVMEGHVSLRILLHSP